MHITHKQRGFDEILLSSSLPFLRDGAELHDSSLVTFDNATFPIITCHNTDNDLLEPLRFISVPQDLPT